MGGRLEVHSLRAEHQQGARKEYLDPGIPHPGSHSLAHPVKSEVPAKVAIGVEDTRAAGSLQVLLQAIRRHSVRIHRRLNQVRPRVKAAVVAVVTTGQVDQADPVGAKGT